MPINNELNQRKIQLFQTQISPLDIVLKSLFGNYYVKLTHNKAEIAECSEC